MRMKRDRMKRDRTKRDRRPVGSAAVALLLLSVFSAGDAAAHEIIPGVTGFSALMLHPLFNQFQVLAITVIGLAIASGKPPTLLLAVVVLPAAMTVGNFMPASAFSAIGGFSAIALAALLVSAAIVAALEDLPIAVACIIAGVLALLIGVDTVPEFPGAWGRGQTILATALTTIATTGFLSLVFGVPRLFWQSVAVRMMSAWIFAATAMMLALRFKPLIAGMG